MKEFTTTWSVVLLTAAATGSYAAVALALVLGALGAALLTLPARGRSPRPSGWAALADDDAERDAGLPAMLRGGTAAGLPREADVRAAQRRYWSDVWADPVDSQAALERALDHLVLGREDPAEQVAQADRKVKGAFAVPGEVIAAGRGRVRCTYCGGDGMHGSHRDDGPCGNCGGSGEVRPGKRDPDGTVAMRDELGVQLRAQRIYEKVVRGDLEGAARAALGAEGLAGSATVHRNLCSVDQFRASVEFAGWVELRHRDRRAAAAIDMRDDWATAVAISNAALLLAEQRDADLEGEFPF